MSHPVQAILRGILTEIETEPILVPWVWNSRGLLIPRLFPRSFRRRARTDHFRKISGTWSGIKLIQQSIVQRIGLQPRDVAICIVNVTKGNCLGWTNLSARRNDFAIFYWTMLFLGINFDGSDALHAIGAFLHYPARPDRHLWVPAELSARRLSIRKLQEIESAHFVRAVVRTIASADAAIIDLLIQTLSAMNGGFNWTNQLAWSGLAMHARYRLVIQLG